MIIPECVELLNGAKLLYCKKKNDITNMNIAFICGARCDGNYPGISHFLEHMLFEKNKKHAEDVAKQISRHTLNQNAFTGENCIAAHFDCVNKELLNSIKLNMKLFDNKKFDEKQMANELKIIKQEMDLYSDMADEESAQSLFWKALTPESEIDLLGSISALKKVTPEILSAYMKALFIRENLVVSVITNKELSEIKEIVENEIVSKFKSNPNNIVNPKIQISYNPINPMIYYPVNDMKTVDINIMLRRDNPVEDEINEAVFRILCRVLNGNGTGGTLMHKFRQEENQAKAYSHYYHRMKLIGMNIDCFNVRTSPKSVKKATLGIIDVIKNLKENGVTKSQFDNAIKTLLDKEDVIETLGTPVKTDDLLHNYIYGKKILDQKLVMDNIIGMEYKTFNEMVKDKFNNSNLMATVEGCFDNRQCLTLPEMRKRLGEQVSKEELTQFNQPKVECEETLFDDEEMILEIK